MCGLGWYSILNIGVERFIPANFRFDPRCQSFRRALLIHSHDAKLIGCGDTVRTTEISSDGFLQPPAAGVTSVLEQMRQRDLEAGKEWRRQNVASLARELEGARKAIAITAVDADDVDIRVDDPVFDDGGVLV